MDSPHRTFPQMIPPDHTEQSVIAAYMGRRVGGGQHICPSFLETFNLSLVGVTEMVLILV